LVAVYVEGNTRLEVSVGDGFEGDVGELIRITRIPIPVPPAELRIGPLPLEEGVEQHIQVLLGHPPLQCIRVQLWAWAREHG
jgi:hypothetical protein